MSHPSIAQSDKLPQRGSLFVFVPLLAIWSLLLIPAAIFCQWFTLDMGGVFTRATGFPENWAWALSPYGKGGRYFPVYWLYNFFVYGMFSNNIAGHFLVQAALFALSLTLTCYLFLKITNHRLATFVFGALACLGGAVAEDLYTLGKGEPLAYLFVILALMIFHGTSRVAQDRLGMRHAVIVGLVSLAIWSKETSLVMFAFAPAAAIISVFIGWKDSGQRVELGHLRRYLWLFLSVTAGYLFTKAPYLLFSKHGDSAGYVDYEINAELVLDNAIFYAADQPDVLLFGLASLFFFWKAATRERSGRESSPASRSDLAFVFGLLAMAWGYYAGLLIWRWPMGYYMLLPSIIFKFTAIYGFLVSRENGHLAGRTMWGTVFLAVAAIVYSAAQTLYIVTSQTSYSRMYTEAIGRYMATSQPSNRLIFESFPFYAEQVTNTKQVIALITGEDRVLGGIADLLNPEAATPELIKMLQISRDQLERNEEFFPRKGDYILVMTGNKLGTWSVRGVTPHFSDESILIKDRAFEMIPVAENKSFSPSAYWDLWANRPYIGNTYIGYKLYQVLSERPRLLWRGRYPDGWTEKKASIRLFPEFGKRAKVTVSTPSFNSPNRVTVKQDGVVIRELPLVEGKEVSFEVDNRSGEVPTSIEFLVDRTVIPKKIKLNKDKREIGVLVRVEPAIKTNKDRETK